MIEYEEENNSEKQLQQKESVPWVDEALIKIFKTIKNPLWSIRAYILFCIIFGTIFTIIRAIFSITDLSFYTLVMILIILIYCGLYYRTKKKYPNRFKDLKRWE
ncbi:MAG: hypothetical protein ACXADY_19555 [Candidatus Hodarchaeales archaeon]